MVYPLPSNERECYFLSVDNHMSNVFG